MTRTPPPGDPRQNPSAPGPHRTVPPRSATELSRAADRLAATPTERPYPSPPVVPRARPPHPSEGPRRAGSRRHRTADADGLLHLTGFTEAELASLGPYLSRAVPGPDFRTAAVRSESARELPGGVPPDPDAFTAGQPEPDPGLAAASSPDDPPAFRDRPPDARVPQRRMRFTTRHRRPAAGALGQLLLHLPWVLCSALLIDKLSYLLLGPPGRLPLLLWLLSGALVFHRPTEELVSRYLLRLERPSLRDLALLEPAWQEVTARAGLDGRGYELWVESGPELNAVATGGHVVAVTRGALDSLRPQQLAAVLAHELGHQQEGNLWAARLGRWYGLPARKLWALLVRLLVLLWRPHRSDVSKPYRYGRRAPSPARDQGRSGPGSAVLLGVAALAFAAWYVTAATYGLPLAMLAAPFLLSGSARRAQYRADRYAARLGYGTQLAGVLEAALRAEQAGPRRKAPVVARLLSARADTGTRLHRLRPHLDKPS